MTDDFQARTAAVPPTEAPSATDTSSAAGGEMLAGRGVLITGANSGVGRATARRLAALGATVRLACRSVERARPLVEELRNLHGENAVEVIQLDLCDLQSVRRAAEEVLGSSFPLDVLVNNAGVAGQRGQTVDGFELAFGTNHLGHFLLTRLLTPALVDSGRGRVVTVASDSHYQAKRIDWTLLTRPTRSVTGLREYAVSKLCNVLHSHALAARFEASQLTAISLHPGVVDTNVWRSVPRIALPAVKRILPMVDEDRGGTSSVFAVTTGDVAACHGRYLDDDAAVAEPNPLVTDRLASELWERSSRWVGLALDE